MNEVIIEKVKYAPTLEGTINKNLKLLSEEEIIYREVGFLYKGSFWRRPIYVILTNKRFIILKHYIFKPDPMYYIPLEILTKISCEKVFWFVPRKAITLQYQDQTLSFLIQARSIKLGYGSYSREKTGELYQLLNEHLSTK